LAASTTPGQDLPERFAFADHCTGGCGTDHEAAIAPANARDVGDLLGIDDQVRLGTAGPQLNEQIGPAGQDFRNAGGSGERADGLLDRRRGGVSEHECGPPK
jgi:hypothetical protein